MTENIILVQCSKCGGKQQTFTHSPTTISGKTKCVYCGKSINRKSQFIHRVRART